jgi:hypothetical protein
VVLVAFNQNRYKGKIVLVKQTFIIPKPFIMKIQMTLLLSAFIVCFFFSSCKKEIEEPNSEIIPSLRQGNQPSNPGFAENDMVLYWNDKVATVLGAPMNQPTRSRYFAMIEIAVHDALNNIKPKYERYALQDRNQHADPGAAVASAAYWAIKGLNRQGNFPVDTWYNESLAGIPDGASKESGIALGKKAADAIIADRTNDGFAQVIAASPFPADGTVPGTYRHTNLLNLKFLPNWGDVVKPFVMVSNDQFRPEGPNPVISTAYAADYSEVKEKGARIGSTRTATEETLAKFWAENRPSIIWNNMARQIIATKKLDAWKTARLFALLHTAMADGMNAALEGAYHFYYWRPETGIHEGANDNNTATSADGSWVPFVVEAPNVIPAANFVSPPIPEYPTVYALYGGLFQKVFSTFFDTDIINVDITSFSLPGVTLHYNSLAQAARDNSLGKIYTGWNFRKTVMDSEEMGRQIGAYIFNHQFREE